MSGRKWEQIYIRRTRNKTKRAVKAAEPRIRGTIVGNWEGSFSIIHEGRFIFSWQEHRSQPR